MQKLILRAAANEERSSASMEQRAIHFFVARHQAYICMLGYESIFYNQPTIVKS